LGVKATGRKRGSGIVVEEKKERSGRRDLSKSQSSPTQKR